MITGELKSQIDKIWVTFWTGEIFNPLTVIEQFTYLLFNSFASHYSDSLKKLNNKHIIASQYNTQLFIKSLLFNSTQKTKQRIYASKDTTTTLINLYEEFIAKRV